MMEGGVERVGSDSHSRETFGFAKTVFSGGGCVLWGSLDPLSVFFLPL